MSLFGKKEFKTVELKLIGGQLDEDIEAGLLSMEAYGNIDGEEIYCYATYTTKKDNYNNGAFDNMVTLLKNYNDLKVPVKLTYKNNKLKKFEIDLNALSNILNNNEFKNLELIGWGLNKKSAFN